MKSLFHTRNFNYKINTKLIFKFKIKHFLKMKFEILIIYNYKKR